MFKSGTPIDVDALNHLTKRRVSGGFSTNNELVAATAVKTLQDSLTVKLYWNDTEQTTPNILQYSVFTVKLSLDITSDTTYDIDRYRTTIHLGDDEFSTGLVYCTNGYTEIVNSSVSSSWFTGQLITDDPIRLRYNADSDNGIPRVGNPCGPNGAGALENHLPGFVALTKPDTDSKTVLVVRSDDVVLVGKVEIAIAAESTGEIVLLSKDLSTELRDPGLDDGEASLKWFMNVINPHKVQWEIGTILKATPILGFGYVVEPFIVEECPEDPASPVPLSF